MQKAAATSRRKGAGLGHWESGESLRVDLRSVDVWEMIGNEEKRAPDNLPDIQHPTVGISSASLAGQADMENVENPQSQICCLPVASMVP